MLLIEVKNINTQVRNHFIHGQLIFLAASLPYKWNCFLLDSSHWFLCILGPLRKTGFLSPPHGRYVGTAVEVFEESLVCPSNNRHLACCPRLLLFSFHWHLRVSCGSDRGYILWDLFVIQLPYCTASQVSFSPTSIIFSNLFPKQ